MAATSESAQELSSQCGFHLHRRLHLVMLLLPSCGMDAMLLRLPGANAGAHPDHYARRYLLRGTDPGALHCKSHDLSMVARKLNIDTRCAGTCAQ